MMQNNAPLSVAARVAVSARVAKSVSWKLCEISLEALCMALALVNSLFAVSKKSSSASLKQEKKHCALLVY